MENLVSVDLIIDWFVKQVENKNPIDPHTYIDAALKLNVLLQSEQEKLFLFEQAIAKIRNIYLDQGKSVSFANSKVKELDSYKDMLNQKAKVDRVIEFIRLAKKYSTTSADLMKNSL